MARATTQTKTKKSKKGLIIGLIIFLLLSAGGFFFGKPLMIRLGYTIHKKKFEEGVTGTSLIKDTKEGGTYTWKNAWTFLTTGVIER